MPEVRILSGPESGRAVTLERGGILRIGRKLPPAPAGASVSDIEVNDAKLSRLHCEVLDVDGGLGAPRLRELERHLPEREAGPRAGPSPGRPGPARGHGARDRASRRRGRCREPPVERGGSGAPAPEGRPPVHAVAGHRRHRRSGGDRRPSRRLVARRAGPGGLHERPGEGACEEDPRARRGFQRGRGPSPIVPGSRSRSLRTAARLPRRRGRPSWRTSPGASTGKRSSSSRTSSSAAAASISSRSGGTCALARWRTWRPPPGTPSGKPRRVAAVRSERGSRRSPGRSPPICGPGRRRGGADRLSLHRGR